MIVTSAAGGDESAIWVRPTATQPAQPVWGHVNGLRVGLHPTGGPRGLLRVYAPYLGQPDGRVINFIAVEPIIRGESERGLSELEHSKLDGVRGKRFWSVDEPSQRTPRPRGEPDVPARGIVEQRDGVETLRVYVQVEPFDGGARVYLRLTFRADRTHEVGIATFAHSDSKPLDYCVVTATMGNYARLRRLHLKDESIVSRDLWPSYKGDGFTRHATFPLSKITHTPDGHAAVSATPDEPDPESAEYSPGTKRHWQYKGQPATQAWRCEAPDPKLEAWVNGRFVYWNSRSPIPGGVSFENFEMVAPYRQGAEYWFSVTPGVDAGATE
jgi:hypothetical protein